MQTKEKPFGGLPATTEALDSGNEAHDSTPKRVQNRSLWQRFTVDRKHMMQIKKLNMNHNTSYTKERERERERDRFKHT